MNGRLTAKGAELNPQQNEREKILGQDQYHVHTTQLNSKLLLAIH